MKTERTVLEFPFSPPDFFEAPYPCRREAYFLVASSGMVRVTLTAPADPLPPDLRARIGAHVESLFKLQQLRLHQPYQLDPPRLYQHPHGGTGSMTVSVEPAATVMAAGSLDFVVRDKSGAIKRDSRVERIAERTAFLDSMSPKVAASPLLARLVDIHDAAMRDHGNELVRLYEIRDALAEDYGGEEAACEALGISKTGWRRLGRLANSEPLQDGRHRGRHVSGSRLASAAERDEARGIVWRWINAFAEQVRP